MRKDKRVFDTNSNEELNMTGGFDSGAFEIMTYKVRKRARCKTR